MKNINIREALLELDKRTSCQYDLTTLYEACKLNDEDKNQLVKYIDAYDHPSVIGGFLASKCEALSEELGDDDVSDLKLIDDINCGEDHTLWSLADKLEDDALELKELTEDIAPDEKAAIAGRVREAATGVLVGKLGYEEDFVDNYMTIDVDDIDDNTRIKVEVRAEVDYDGLMTLGQALDPIVKEYDKNAYFEPVTSGIMSAYIRKDQSDDIPDEAAVKEWTDRFNACQTKDDVIAVYRDLIKVRDNNEVTWGTIEAIYDVIDAKMDSLGESLNEALFTVPTDYEDYCPYCATRALKGVGDGRAVCDSCGAEYEVTALGNDRVRLDPLFISEAVSNDEWFVGDNESGHMYPNKEAAQKAYDNLVKSGVQNAVMHPAVEESLVEGDQLDSKFADERYEFTPQDGVTYKSYIGDKEVPYETYEDAKAHLKDDFKITDYRADLQQFLTDNDCHHTVDETTDGRLVISINWGDWKHDHMMVDALVDEFFNSKGLVVKTQKETTEEDGSDTYSAEHYYDIDSLYFKRVPVEEAFDVDKVAKRIARHNEFDNGHVLHNYERMTSAEAEEKARLASIEDPDDIYYVSYDNIMNPSSDIKWKNGKQLTEDTSNGVRYQVTANIMGMDDVHSEHHFLKSAIDAAREAQSTYTNVKIKDVRDGSSWLGIDNAEADLNDGLVESTKLILSESDDTDILYNTEEPDDYDGIEAGHQFIEDGHEWTLFKQCGETVHLDFDNWAVWWAYRPEIDGDENSTAISGFFVVDTDTGFIDWGPCDTAEEAQQFLQSKVDDYNMDEAIEPEKVFDKDGNEIEPPLGRCKCGKALVAGEGEEPHCPKCGNSISESINVGDKVKVTTPGNNHYDGRTGVVDYAEDGIVTVKFDDDKSPKLNNFDLNQVTKIDESKSIKEDLETFNSLKQKLADGAFDNYVAYDSEYSDFIDALYNDAVAKLEKEYKDLYIEPSIQNGRGSVFASYDDNGQTHSCHWSYEDECEIIEEFILEADNEEEFITFMCNYIETKLEDASTGEDDYDDYDESLAKPQELDEGLFDDDFSDEEIASITDGNTKNDMPDGLETPSETEARLAEINEAIFGTDTHIIKIGDTLTSKSGHKIHIDDMSATLTPFEKNAIVTFRYSYEMTDGTTGKSECTTPDLKNMLQEDVTDVATATLEGPEEGAAAGVASLINDAIQDELKTADEYNAISITAKAEGHEDIAAVIDEINTEEHKHIGQLEKALEKVAPNAEAIEVGKVEGEQQLGEVTDTVVVKEGIQPDDLAANVEDAFVRDELDLFVADALSDGSATEETLLTIANDSSNIELDDMKKAINAYKESLDTNNSNSTLNNNSDKDVLEESEVTESWEKIYQSFKTIEKELNQDGEAVTAVIDKMYQDNKDDPDYQKAYDKWASGE